MLKVLIVGQTPPPYGGACLMIERLLQHPISGVRLIHVPMAFSSDMKHVGRFSLSKLTHLFAVIVRIVYRRFADRVRILYYPPAGPDRVPMFRDFVILLATRWLFDKTIFHYHASGVSELYDELPAWQRWLFRRAYFGADAAIRISALNPEDGRRLAAKRDYVVPNGIEDPCPQAVGAISTSLDGRPVRILFVGVLCESKGVLVLVEACGKLASSGVPFQLELMGQWQSEEFAARVRQRIDELNLSQRARFLGVLIGDEKFAAFRRADAFCFPSFFNSESFGVVLLEAMACGLPIVATRWRGIPSVVEDEKTGFLVEPHDPGAIADRVIRLAEDDGLRARMGAAGRDRFLRDFTLTRHLDRMRDVFLEVAGVEHEPTREVPKHRVQPDYQHSDSVESMEPVGTMRA